MAPAICAVISVLFKTVLLWPRVSKKTGVAGRKTKPRGCLVCPSLHTRIRFCIRFPNGVPVDDSILTSFRQPDRWILQLRLRKPLQAVLSVLKVRQVAFTFAQVKIAALQHFNPRFTIRQLRFSCRLTTGEAGQTCSCGVTQLAEPASPMAWMLRSDPRGRPLRLFSADPQRSHPCRSGRSAFRLKRKAACEDSVTARAVRQGKQPDTVVRKISQEMLAEMIGTTRSRVSFL